MAVILQSMFDDQQVDLPVIALAESGTLTSMFQDGEDGKAIPVPCSGPTLVKIAKYLNNPHGAWSSNVINHFPWPIFSALFLAAVYLDIKSLIALLRARVPAATRQNPSSSCARVR